MPRQKRDKISDPATASFKSVLDVFLVLPSHLPGPRWLYSLVYPAAGLIGFLIAARWTQLFANLVTFSFLICFGIIGLGLVSFILPPRLKKRRMVAVAFVMCYAIVAALIAITGRFMTHYADIPIVRDQADQLTTGIVQFPEARLSKGEYVIRVYAEHEETEKIVIQKDYPKNDPEVALVLKYEDWRQATKIEFVDSKGVVKYSRYVNFSDRELRERSFNINVE